MLCRRQNFFHNAWMPFYGSYNFHTMVVITSIVVDLLENRSTRPYTVFFESRLAAILSAAGIPGDGAVSPVLHPDGVSPGDALGGPDPGD
jgi:hypothetical protein